MRCHVCEDKGYIESTIAKDATFTPMITKCTSPQCPHDNKYYDEIRSRYSEGNTDLHYNVGVDESDSPDKLVMSGDVYDPYEFSKHDSDIPPDDFDDVDHLEDMSDLIPSASVSVLDKDKHETFTHLPKVFVDAAQGLLDSNPTATICFMTPFGPLVTKDLIEANRVAGICTSYYNKSDELDHADKQENVIVFPLGRALDMEMI